MITAPAGFVEIEQTTVLHRPAPDVGVLRRAKESAPPPRPSIVVVKRRSNDDAEQTAARMCEELLRVVPGARSLSNDAFEFDDAHSGRIICITFDVMSTLSAKQWIAVRSDGAHVVTATFTAPLNMSNDDEARAALRTLRIA